MAILIHPHFRSSIAQYRECEQFWKSLLNDVHMGTCTIGQWHRWVADCHPGGTPFGLREFELDGSAIANGRSYATNRAYVINQQPPDNEYEYHVAAWINDYRYGYPSTWPVASLVIDLVLSEETAEIAKRLLIKWMYPETTIEDMSKYITAEIPDC